MLQTSQLEGKRVNGDNSVLLLHLLNCSIGTCQRYLSQSDLCNGFYSSTDYIFTAMNQSFLSRELESRVPPILSGVDGGCNELISKVVCHYFFAPCGANGLLHLPLSVCPEECHYVQSACEHKWNIMNSLLNNAELGIVNCNRTGNLLQGLSPCCTDAQTDLGLTSMLN